MPGGAIIAFQSNDGGAWEILFKAQDVIDLGAAPAIDRLVVVADAAEVRRALGQQAQPQILGNVGVLILINENVAETAVVLRQNVRVLHEKPEAFEKKIAEVGSIQLLQTRLIGRIKFTALSRSERLRFGSGDLIGCQAAVLPTVDQGRKLTGRPAILVEA